MGGFSKPAASSAMPSLMATAQSITGVKQRNPPSSIYAPPDLTDETVRKAKQSERQRQLAATGLKSTFISGPQGVSNPAPVTGKSLLGQ